MHTVRPQLCHSSAVALVVALLISLAGCASFQGAPERADAEVSLEASDRLHHEALQSYYATPLPEEQKLARNRFIEIRAGLIDHKYAVFKQEVYQQRVGGNVGVDVATLGLNGIGAAVSATGAKTALHAVSAGLIGSKASIDKNAYFDRTLPALLSQMDAARATVRLRLMNGMLVDTVRYSLMQAAADLEGYFQAGTFAGAIEGITTQAAVEQQTAVKKLERGLPSEAEVTRRLSAMGFEVRNAIETPVSDAFVVCLQPGGLRDPRRQATLRDWLKNERFAGLDGPFAITDFLTQPANEQLRRKALADPTLRAALVGCNLPIP